MPDERDENERRAREPVKDEELPTVPVPREYAPPVPVPQPAPQPQPQPVAPPVQQQPSEPIPAPQPQSAYGGVQIMQAPAQPPPRRRRGDLSGVQFPEITGTPEQVAAFERFGAQALLAHQAHHHALEQGSSHVDDQARLHQIQLNQTEQGRMNRLQAAEDHVRNDATLNAADRANLITQIRTGLNPYELRSQQAQILQHEAQTSQIREATAHTITQNRLMQDAMAPGNYNPQRRTTMIGDVEHFYNGHAWIPVTNPNQTNQQRNRTLLNTMSHQEDEQLRQARLAHDHRNTERARNIDALPADRAPIPYPPELKPENHQEERAHRLYRTIQLHNQFSGEDEQLPLPANYQPPAWHRPGAGGATPPPAGQINRTNYANTHEGYTQYRNAIRPVRTSFPVGAHGDRMYAAAALEHSQIPEREGEPVGGPPNPQAADALSPLLQNARDARSSFPRELMDANNPANWNAGPGGTYMSRTRAVNTIHSLLTQAVGANRSLNAEDVDRYREALQYLLDEHPEVARNLHLPAGIQIHGTNQRTTAQTYRGTAAELGRLQGTLNIQTAPAGLHPSLSNAVGAASRATLDMEAIVRNARQHGRGLTPQERTRYNSLRAVLATNRDAGYGRLHDATALPE